MRKYALGCDIGGSHISCAAVELESGEFLPGSHSAADVNNLASADEILDIWTRTLKKSIAKIEGEIEGVGFAMPGPFEYHTGIARFNGDNVKYVHLNGINVSEVLKSSLGFKSTSQIRYINDATAFAMGEAWKGTAAGKQNSVAITLGTGFGSAFIRQGIPVVDGDDVPLNGCVWHLPYKKGIADDYFSTRWFVKRYAEVSGETLPGVKEIEARVNTDVKAIALFVEFGHNLADFIAPWLIKFKSDQLVIGGNISRSFPLFGPQLLQKLATFNVLSSVGISALKEDAALIGSARLFDEQLWGNIVPLLPKM
jgi:glucokinase